MTIDIPQWVQLSGEFFLILGIIGVVIVYLRSDVQRKTSASLKEWGEALEKRVEALESERADLLHRVDSLEKENAVLRSLVTGEAKTNELLEATEENHAEVMAVLSEIRDVFAS